MASSAKTVSGKALAIYGPIFLFVLCGFEHSIANMFYGPAGIFTAIKNNIPLNDLNFISFFFNNILPITIGNLIGGAGIVSCLYYFAYLKTKK